MSSTTSTKVHFDTLQSYYASLESRIGYHLFLNGTRHFGFYKSEHSWPWPIDEALRAMEDLLFDNLDLPAGSLVLDAGCGYGHVACRGAERGLRVECIDIVPRHVTRAQRSIHERGFDSQIHARLGDYHDLSAFRDSSFDGVYTMETFVHANDPERVLAEFFRVMKPGAHISMNEYEHLPKDEVLPQERKAMDIIDTYSAMPAHNRFVVGAPKKMLESAGFVDVQVDDISPRTLPLARLFYVIAYVPYLILCFLGLQHHFVNAVAAVESYRLGKKGVFRYIVIRARKPGSLGQVEARDDASIGDDHVRRRV